MLGACELVVRPMVLADPYVREHRFWHTPDLVLYLLQLVDTLTLARTGCVSRSLRVEARAELRRRVRIVLSRHVPAAHFDEFLELLQSTSSVVSGSLAFAVLSWGSPTHFGAWRKPGDLDVYVPIGRTKPFTLFFRRLAGFMPAHPDDVLLRQGSYPKGINTVTTLVDIPARIPLAPVSIDIVESCCESAVFPLQYFWGTAVNNYITSTSVVSAYPDFTFGGVSYRHPWAGDIVRRVREKYESRGVEIITGISELQYVLVEYLGLFPLNPCSSGRKIYASTERFARQYLVLDFAPRVGRPSVVRVCSSSCVGMSWKVVEWENA